MMWAMLRELKTEQERTLSVRDLIVRELRRNADVVENYPHSWSISDVAERLVFTRWEQHGTEWSALRKRHRELWHEVADAYGELEVTASQGAGPPPAERLRDLAERLESAEL
jgi:hypothetical protein